MAGKIRAQLIGATGYGGLGIMELLLAHPNFEISALVARDDAGKRIDDIYPHLAGRCEMVVQAPDSVEVGADCDVVIFATPDRVSQQYAESLTARGVRFIDYSGDFRFTSTDDYARYAERHPSIADNTTARRASWAETPMASPNSTPRRSPRRRWWATRAVSPSGSSSASPRSTGTGSWTRGS